MPGAKPWQPGQSGNPNGAGHAYHEAVKLARTKHKAGIERMVQLAELDSVDETGALAPLSRRSDARVAAMATQWLWEVAWGKGRSPDKAMDAEPGMTIEQRRDEAMAILQASFERILQASRAQAQAEQAGTYVEPEFVDEAE